MKIRKKILAFILTTVIVISGSGGFLTVGAAEGSLNDKIRESMEDGIELTSSLTCSGEPAEYANGTLFIDHLKKFNMINITLRFKVTDWGGKTYTSLLEICDKSNNSLSASSAQSSIAVIVSASGSVFWEAGANSAKDGTDWQTDTGVRISDGAFHTLEISVSGNSFKCSIDNSAVKEVTKEGTRETKSYMTAFFGGTAASYTDWRNNINAVVIGGLSEGSYFEHPSTYANLTGEISQLKIQGGLAPDSQTGSGFASGMFSEAADNTWLFGGGIETQGRFAEIGGIRNYIGQFEEFVRWRCGGSSDAPLPMQRYVINVGKEGCDAVQFAASLEKYIERTAPKAVSYFIGSEDYCKGEEGIEAFKTALASIIQTSLGMKGGNGGYVVIQLPHAVTDAEMSKNVSAYAAAAREVYNEAASDEEKADRMALVDHLAATQEESFKTENLTGDLLNAKGHLEIARQLTQTVRGSTSNFPEITKSFTAEEAPDVYRKEIPEAVVSQNNLNVTVPDEIKASSFEYRLTVLGTTISGTAYQNPFVIKDLPAEEEYELLVLCKDENTVTQLSPVEGVVTDQNTAKRPEITGELAKAIRQKAEGEEPLTWLFMGDSITHGAQHTGGYDSIAQLFEKYLKEDLGRTDDIVVNTAVSGATTGASTGSTGRGTLTHMEQRMAKYKPDIVSVMLGTNDSINDNYNANLKQIADEIRTVNKDAIIIFRAPSPAGRTYASKLPGETGSVARMKKVADENGILFIDQYTDWNKELDAYSYLYNADHYFGDGYLHPGGAGHVRMTTQFIRECGLDTNTRIANLSYQFAYTDETSDIVPAIEPTAEKDGVTISKTALQTAYGNGTIGDMTVVLTDADGKTYTKELGLDDTEAVIKLPKNRRYTVNVTAMPKGSAAKRVAFAEQEILLGEESVNTADQKAADDVAELIREIGDVTGTISPAAKQKIEKAREAYEALTDQQKLLISNDVIRLLADAEEAVDSQEAEAVKDQIKDLENISGETITEAEAEEIKSVLAAYQELTDRQKSFISAALKEQLAKAEEVLNQKEEADKKAADKRAADSAVAKIQAIGSVSGTAECKKKIDDARAAYNALTSEQKQLVSADIEKLLTDAEALYAKLISTTKTEQKFEIGKTYEDKNYLYRITGDSTAEAAGIKADTEKTITIPDAVSFGGKTYQVTSIQASVFSKKTAASAVIGKNVEIIGKNAFAGCKKLKKVTIKSTRLKEIQSKAFSNCKALKNITIKSKVLKKAGKNCLKGIHKKAVIKVPSSKYKDYVKRLAKKGQSKTVKIKK